MVNNKIRQMLNKNNEIFKQHRTNGKLQTNNKNQSKKVINDNLEITKKKYHFQPHSKLSDKSMSSKVQVKKLPTVKIYIPVF